MEIEIASLAKNINQMPDLFYLDSKDLRLLRYDVIFYKKTPLNMSCTKLDIVTCKI